MNAAGRNKITSTLIQLIGMSVASTIGFAQDAPTQPSPVSTTTALAKSTKDLQQVLVTGTRQSRRTLAESLAPIDVLTKTDLAASGGTDLASALSTLLPSLDSPRSAISFIESVGG